MDRVELWTTARQILDAEEMDSRDIRAVMLVLAAPQVGPRINNLRAFTGIPIANIQHASWWLRRAKIWTGSRVYAPWVEPDCPHEVAVVTIVTHSLVATGDVTSDDGQTFRMRLLGDVFGEASYQPAEVAIPWADWVRRRDLPHKDLRPEWLDRAG